MGLQRLPRSTIYRLAAPQRISRPRSSSLYGPAASSPIHDLSTGSTAAHFSAAIFIALWACSVFPDSRSIDWQHRSAFLGRDLHRFMGLQRLPRFTIYRLAAPQRISRPRSSSLYGPAASSPIHDLSTGSTAAHFSAAIFIALWACSVFPDPRSIDWQHRSAFLGRDLHRLLELHALLFLGLPHLVVDVEQFHGWGGPREDAHEILVQRYCNDFEKATLARCDPGGRAVHQGGGGARPKHHLLLVSLPEVLLLQAVHPIQVHMGISKHVPEVGHLDRHL